MQDGLFTAAQARNLGASRAQLHALAAAGTIERVQHGVYHLVGTPVDRWVSLRAAWMAVDPERSTDDRLTDPVGPGAVVSHRSAAQLLGLGEVDADVMEMCVPRRRDTRNPAVRLRIAQIDSRDWFIREGLPVTTPAATVGMLAQDLTDAGHLGAVARDSVLRYDVDVDELGRRLAPSAKRYGYDDVEDMLEQTLLAAGTPVPSVDLSALLAGANVEALAASSERVQQVLESVRRDLVGLYDQRAMATYTKEQSRVAEQARRVLAASGVHEEFAKVLNPALEQLHRTIQQRWVADPTTKAKVAEATQTMAQAIRTMQQRERT